MAAGVATQGLADQCAPAGQAPANHKAIAAELDRRTVQLVKVPGHAGHPLNERADRLAAAAAAQAALRPQ